MEILERIRNFEVQDEVSQAVYQRGIDYHKQRLVRLVSSSENQISLQVMGNELYTVDFYLKKNRINYECSCPAYCNWGTCKHCLLYTSPSPRDS